MKTLIRLKRDWHDERIVACTEACEGIENLNIVRAAPDMLTAIEQFLKYLEHGTGGLKQGHVEAFRSVVKKARGLND